MAEDAYLDALEALTEGKRKDAIELASALVKAEPDHAAAWALLSDAYIPEDRKVRLTLDDTAKAIGATRFAVKLDPRRTDLWIRGAVLMRSIGCWEDALQWWQDARHHMPKEAMPLVEQATILADLGMYDEAAERLEQIIEENLDVGPSQNARIMALLNLVRKAATKDRAMLFRPWEPHHDGWDIIRLRMRRGPISENTIFLMTAGPALMLLVLMAQNQTERGWSGFCLVSMAILATTIVGMRLSRRWHQQINRPALNLVRAMDVEASSGHVLIPEDIRISRLHAILLQRTPQAYQARVLKIVERGRTWPKGHLPRLPDFDSHLDEIGFIEDEDVDMGAFEDDQEGGVWESE